MGKITFLELGVVILWDLSYLRTVGCLKMSICRKLFGIVDKPGTIGNFYVGNFGNY